MKIEMWDIARIIPCDRNFKNHDAEQVKGIATSIKRFGWDQPIVVDANGEIIKGHGRRLAAISLGMSQAPVLQRLDLNEEEVRAARAADNRSALGSYDMDLMQSELKTMEKSLLEGIFANKELEFNEADLGTMNSGVFETDIETAVQQQTETMNEALNTAAAGRVPIGKALGFKDIQVTDQVYVTRFIGQIEADTGKKGEQAFVEFLKKLLED